MIARQTTPLPLLLLLALTQSIWGGSLPIIIQSPVNVTAVPGDSVKFKCEAVGNPTPDILIVRQATHLSNLFLDEDSAGLRPSGAETAEAKAVSVFKTLNNIRKADSGWYECIASNSEGFVTSEAFLDVLTDPCEGVKCSSRKTCHVLDYSAGITECRCKECDEEDFKPVCGSDCTSYINTCQMKKESCESGLGLSVLHKGMCNIQEAKLKVSGDTEVMEGDQINLTCEASGFPEPIGFRWAKIMKNGRQKIVGTGKRFTVKTANVKDSGDYRCIAQQCKNRIKSELVTVKVDYYVVEDSKPKDKTCRVFGDPHVQTFDGKKFDFMGRCNYIMSVDCSYTNKWMVLGQFTKCGEGVTCLEQITVYYGSMVPLTLARGWIVGQNGKKFRLHKNKEAVIDEATLTYTGMAVEISFPDLQLIWDGFWGIQITVEENARTCGLCGDNNGDISDDVLIGRYGNTGGDVTVFGQSWAMWNPDWCGIEEIPSGGDNSTCVDGKLEEVESECDAILESEVFADCTAAMGGDFFRETCVMDGCKTQVERYEGSSVCAVTASLAQICALNGFDIPDNFLEEVGCGPKRKFQENVYNAGCPLAGNPPFLEQ